MNEREIDQLARAVADELRTKANRDSWSGEETASIEHAHDGDAPVGADPDSIG